MFLAVLWLIGGFILLIKGADFLVSGAKVLAQKFYLSEIVIGLTIVAFGTSLPELVVNLFASGNGYSDVVLGNIFGSNIFNIFFILGVTGLIFPLTVQDNTAWKEIPFSLFITMLVMLMVNKHTLFNLSNQFAWPDGIILLAFFGLSLWYILQNLKADHELKSTEGPLVKVSNKIIILKIAGGLAGLIIGGNFVVNNATTIAQLLGMSQRMIGLTIVAAGTSLPELVTSVLAAYRKSTDIAVGNVIGSNIFNLLFILGVSFIIGKDLEYSLIFNFDLLLLVMGSAALFLFMFTGKYKKLDWFEAFALLIIFIGYMLFLIIGDSFNF